MRLFFAGNPIAGNPELYKFGIKRKLVSFAGINEMEKSSFEFWIERWQPDMEIFLDSGAFSAHTRGAVIDLGIYCDYILSHLPALHCYAALDVIGDFHASHVNLRYMRDRGLHPLPVFHSGEPYSVLADMLAEDKHIALGGMASDSPSRADLQKYLDKCFSVIGRFWPVQVHGFGIMAQWALERYPFYSVDSSSAIVSAGMGMVSSFERGTIRSHHWEEYSQKHMNGAIMDHVSELRAKGGSAHMGRRKQNIDIQRTLEDHVTRLWETRGITW